MNLLTAVALAVLALNVALVLLGAWVAARHDNRIDERARNAGAL